MTKQTKRFATAAITGLFAGGMMAQAATAAKPASAMSKMAKDAAPAAATTTTTTTTTAPAAASVHCMGGNSCKGKGGCKTVANACAGHNGCKGKGGASMTATAEECTKAGGKVETKPAAI